MSERNGVDVNRLVLPSDRLKKMQETIKLAESYAPKKVIEWPVPKPWVPTDS
jgi:hypothetical protein